MPKEKIIVAEKMPVRGERGSKPSFAIIRYKPGFEAVYGVIINDNGAAELAVFGDDSRNMRLLRQAWRDWGNDSQMKSPGEWSFSWVVRSFVGWLNSGARRGCADCARRDATAGARSPRTGARTGGRQDGGRASRAHSGRQSDR
jgi:hypothetical protein